MKIPLPILTLLFLLVAPAHAPAAPDAETIITKTEDKLNGDTAFLKITMIVETSRTERTMRMESYSIGKEKSFIKITYPKKDEGITFLKIDEEMWQYVPRIEKIIKIPPSMMLQSWMGSDFTNDDLVKESSISEDYDASLLGESETEYSIELIPHEDAAVVWGRIVMGVHKDFYLPTRVEYYDEDDELIRILRYEDRKQYNDRIYPSRWLVEPKTPDKKDNRTIIEVDEAVFDEKINPAYFTKRALKRFSR